MLAKVDAVARDIREIKSEMAQQRIETAELRAKFVNIAESADKVETAPDSGEAMAALFGSASKRSRMSSPPVEHMPRVDGSSSFQCCMSSMPSLLEIVIDHLDVFGALSMMMSHRSTHAILHVGVVSKSKSSIWCKPQLRRLPFSILREANQRLLDCMDAVQSDSCFIFHVHIMSSLTFCGLNDSDNRQLGSIGCLKNWRPGNPRPSRNERSFELLQSEYREWFDPDDYTPDIEIHLLPRPADLEIRHPQVCARCQSHRVIEEGLFDIEYGIGVLHKCEPPSMLHHSGLAKVIEGAGGDGPSFDPVMLWLLHAEYDVLIDNESSTFALLGFFDGVSGDFVLASVRKQLFGNDVLFPDERADEQEFDVLVVRYRSWDDMSQLVQRCHAYSIEKMMDFAELPAEALPSGVRPMRPENSPEDLHSDRKWCLRFFQNKLHDCVLEDVGAVWGAADGAWVWPSGIRRAPSLSGNESEDWILCGNASLKVQAPSTQAQAKAATGIIFRETVGDAAYRDLCRCEVFQCQQSTQ